MSRILRVNNTTVEIGMDSGEIKNYPIAFVEYANPQVGDIVDVYAGRDEVSIIKNESNKQQESGYYVKEKKINKHIFIWIGTFLFGAFGVDRFMRGQIALGIIKLLTLGCWGIWTLVDFIIALVKCYGNSFNDTEEVMFINGSYGR